MRYWLWSVISCVFVNPAGLQASEADKENETPTFGIRIEEKHIRVMRALADMLFSYNERNGNPETEDSQQAQLETANDKNEADSADLAINAPEKNNVLRVGVVGDCLPFCARRGAEFVGFEADLVRLLAQEGGYEYQFVPVDRCDVPKQLEQKKLDAVIGGNVFDADSAVTNGYSEGYLSVDLGIVYRKIRNKNGFNLMNQSIGVIRGSYGEKMLADAHIQGTPVVPCDDIHSLLLHVLDDEKNNSVDGVLIDNRTAQDWIAQYPELTYHSLNLRKELAFLLSAGTQWKSAIDQGLQEVMKSQKFWELLDRWSLGKI